MRQVAKLAGLEQLHGEARVFQQQMDLLGRVLAVVARIHLARFGRPDVGVKEARMIALQNRRDGPQRGHIRGGQHQVAAGLENAVHLAHQVHGIFEQVLDQLAAQHRGVVFVGIREAVLFGVEMVDGALETSRLRRTSPRDGRCGPGGP